MKNKERVSLLALVEEKIDVRELIEGIEFDESNLIEAAVAQAKLFWNAGRYRVQRAHRTNALQTKLRLAQSQNAQRFRRLRDEKGKQSLTEGGIKEKVETSADVRRLTAALDAAVSKEELAKQLVEVYRMRRDMLRIIMDAGKISVHAQELEMMKGSRKLRSMVEGVREKWKSDEL